MTYKLHLPNDSTRNPYRVHHDGQPKQWHCMMCGNVVTAQIKPKRCPECEIGKMEAWTTLPTDTASSLSD